MNIVSPSRRMVLFGICALLSCLLSSCGFGIWTRSLFGGKVNVKITVAPNVNQDNPIQVEMLLVYDEALLKQILQLPAKEWFEKRDEIRKNYPDGAGYDSWKWEWIPNQAVGIQQVPLRVSAIATIVFANYYVPGPHRIRVSPHENITVTLLETGFTVDTE